MKNIANDIIVYGQTREEHGMNLDKGLQRLFDQGLCLNQTKCSSSRTLKFFGQIFSGNSTQPDPVRVKDLQDAPKPTSVHDVRSLLRMANIL